MKLRTFWRNLVHFLTIMREDYPRTPLVLFLYSFTGAARPYWNLFFSARILDFLIRQDYRAAILNTVFLIGGTLVLGLIFQKVQAQKYIYELTLDESISRQIADKAYVLEYDVYESAESMDRLHAIRSSGGFSIGSGWTWRGINDLFLYVFQILFSVFFMVRLLLSSKGLFSSFDVLFWGVIIGLILILILNAITSKHNYQALEQLRKDTMHSNAVFDYLSNISTNIKYKKEIMLNHIDPMIHGYFNKNNFTNAYMTWCKQDARFMSVNAFFMMIYTAICYLFVGLRALRNLLPIGDVLLYASSMQRLSTNLITSISIYNNLVQQLDFINEYYDYIHQPALHYTGTLPIEKRADTDYELEFRNVSFAYPGTDQYILKDINLKFNVGQKLALVGRNGAGKSTIIKLLCRLYEPTEGEILLNGISIWKYDYAEYTQIFAPVFQDFKLFSLPIAENIAGDMNYDAERIEQALKKADIWNRVSSMPDGIHTQLYHNNGDGVEVSGGEAQKMAIARAWYKDAPFIILDEPTAALDPLSEAEIYENFNSLIENKTAIYISHRMSSCKFCDSIVVLKDGQIVEQGTHASLLAENGEYAMLYNAQAEYYV